jgi:hypothetical protein
MRITEVKTTRFHSFAYPEKYFALKGIGLRSWRKSRTQDDASNNVGLFCIHSVRGYTGSDVYLSGTIRKIRANFV